MQTGLPHYDIWFYVATFSIASLAGMVSACTDKRVGRGWDVFAAGVLGGFVAAASVGVLVGSLGGTSGSEPRYMGLAIMVGLTGKSSLKIAYYVLDKIANSIGMKLDDRQE